MGVESGWEGRVGGALKRGEVGGRVSDGVGGHGDKSRRGFFCQREKQEKHKELPKKKKLP